RDYTLALSAAQGEAPLLSVFGGKLTTYRKLAESAMAELKPFFSQMGQSWTANSALPGGEGMSTPQALVDDLLSQHQWLAPDIAKRWAVTYGSRTWQLLEGVNGPDDLGQAIGGGLFTREVDYLRETEWAVSTQDILWRRTKLGLFTSDSEQRALADYLAQGDARSNAA
ncbi:MAG: glycerol-3-phosphate dehydrogenase C-terminal domain-containing protein, partial [Pseudomonas capeferrum]